MSQSFLASPQALNPSSKESVEILTGKLNGEKHILDLILERQEEISYMLAFLRQQSYCSSASKQTMIWAARVKASEARQAVETYRELFS